MQVKFPIQHIEQNLVFGADESVWAYYRVPLRDYTYRSQEEKVSVLNEWVRLLNKIEAEMHILSVPRFFDFDHHEQRLKEDIPDGPLKEVAESYISQMMERLREKQAESKLSRPGDTAVLLGVKLARTRRQKGLMYHLKDFLRVVHDAAGVEPYPILPEELKKAQKKEEQTFEKLRACIWVQRASVMDLQYLVAHSAYRGIGEPRLIPTEKPQGAQKLLNLITGEYVVEPQYIQVRQYHDGELREGYMQFLYITDLPIDIYYPGEEWISWAYAFPFPVDVSIRIRPVPNEQAVKLMEKKKRNLMSAVGHTRIEGKTQDLLLEETYFDSAEAEKDLKKSGVPLLRTTVCFCIYAPTLEEMTLRTRIFIRDYERKMSGLKLVISPGDQLFAFHEFLPGSPVYIKDFTQWVKPEMVAGGAINAGQQLGDERGMFIGFTGPQTLPAKSLSRPVFVHQALAAQGGERVETKSPAVLVVGLPGFGKSFAGALLTYQAILHLGARVLLFDVKGERGEWPEKLPLLKGHVSLIRVGGDPKYQGMFDPFHVFKRDKAPLYATDFLAQLLQIDLGDEAYTVIQQAIGEVAQQEEPSMKKVLDRIRDLDERLYHRLALYERYPFSQLVFGDRKPENAIELDKPLNIIQIDELSLPQRDKNPKHYNVKERLSVALMLPLTGFAQQVVKKDRDFKIIWWEEAWVPMASDQGREAIDQGIRMGRYWNSETLIVTQNPSDVPDQLLNNIGMRFVFRTESESEVVKALEILGLPHTAANRSLIKNLREGECFFRDIYGQVGRLKVDGLFANLQEAFDTTPPLEKAKKKPKEGVAG